MAANSQKATEYAHYHKIEFLSDLKDFLNIPSISTDPDHQADMVRAAEWLKQQLASLGFDNLKIFNTKRHPIVYGDYLQAGPVAPTILVYGHYDVQPVDPIELWATNPFDPIEKGQELYGRGASDMKGQVISSLKALESILKTGPLPVNVKFMLEGEEEIGSPNLDAFMKEHKALLACDIVLNPDAGMIAPDVPTIVYALRGLAYFELRVYGPAHDLHSGLFGGVVHNPAQALCELIAGMHDDHGHVTLPGFYDQVKELSEEERQELSLLPTNEEFFLEKTGVPQIWGDGEFSPGERVGSRPTLEINGILSGFTGAGTKTVIPAWAMAKISSRLVPDQTPEDVDLQLRKYLQTNAPSSIRWELTTFGGGPACFTERDLPATRALVQALESVWGKRVVYKREGGSIPVVAGVRSILGVSSVLTGFGLPDDNAHAPNEKLDLPTWYRGIDALIQFFYNMEDTPRVNNNAN
ncbi:MAG: dipeptidase [Anaerolineaceae bacterium]|jgi:acetylornithine deacetylase/succinyl-diaminopimelate desuccinylase-like protein